MTNQQSLDKFIQRIESFILELKKKNTLPVQSQIDQFFYMQKLEELKLLVERIKEESKKLRNLEDSMESARKEMFIAWKRDSRWLIKHKAGEKFTPSEQPSN